MILSVISTSFFYGRDFVVDHILAYYCHFYHMSFFYYGILHRIHLQAYRNLLQFLCYIHIKKSTRINGCE